MCVVPTEKKEIVYLNIYRLRAGLFFLVRLKQNARDTQMTTRVTATLAHACTSLIKCEEKDCPQSKMFE